MDERDKLKGDEQQVIVSVPVDHKKLFCRCTAWQPHEMCKVVRCCLGSCSMKPLVQCHQKDGMLLRGWHFYLKRCRVATQRKIARSSDTVHTLRSNPTFFVIHSNRERVPRQCPCPFPLRFLFLFIKMLSNKEAKIFFSLLLTGFLKLYLLFSHCLPEKAAVKRRTLRAREKYWSSAWLTVFLQEIEMLTILNLRQRKTQSQFIFSYIWQPLLISYAF